METNSFVYEVPKRGVDEDVLLTVQYKGGL